MEIRKSEEQIRTELQAMLDHNIKSGPGTLEYILRREIAELDAKKGFVEYKFTVPQSALNETNTAHGGYHAAMLDEGMGYAARAFAAQGDTVKTADLQINCLAPAHLGEEARLKVQVIKIGKRLVVLKAEMYQNGVIVSMGTGSYARVEY